MLGLRDYWGALWSTVLFRFAVGIGFLGAVLMGMSIFLQVREHVYLEVSGVRVALVGFILALAGVSAVVIWTCYWLTTRLPLGFQRLAVPTYPIMGFAYMMWSDRYWKEERALDLMIGAVVGIFLYNAIVRLGQWIVKGFRTPSE